MTYYEEINHNYIHNRKEYLKLYKNNIENNLGLDFMKKNIKESKQMKKQWVHKDGKMKILQKNSEILRKDLEEGKIDIALIQEGSIYSKKQKEIHGLVNYELIKDEYNKTCIYIHMDI